MKPALALALMPFLGLMISSCSGGVAPTAPVTVSSDDLKQGQVFIAKQLLDTIERLPPNQRQVAANISRNAEALYGASQSDPAIKKRIEDLGIIVSPPVERKRLGH